MWDSGYLNPIGLAPEERMPDAQTEEFRRIAKQRYEYCVALASIFKTEQGKRVLDKWRTDTIESACWMPSLIPQYGFEGANAHAYAREGQNAFIKHIEDCIRVANECKTIDQFCARITEAVDYKQL